MNGWGVLVIIIVLLLVFGGGGWIFYRQYRARKLGLPAPPLNPFAKSARATTSGNYQPPAPAAGGIGGWLSSKIQALRNPRSSAGAYESTSFRTGAGGGGRQQARGGFGPLDPDEAWDSRVGNEADYGGPGGGGPGGPYYEDTELGLRDPGSGPYGGGGYGEGVGVGGAVERGRSRSRQRELDERYDEEMHGGARSNPFGDGAERSSLELRGVSPRPVVERERSRDGREDRRSAFREGI